MNDPILLPYQREYLADDSQIRIAEKSRRIGISWALAADFVMDAGAADGCDCWYITYAQRGAEEFIRDCAWWAEQVHGVAVSVGEEIFEGNKPDQKILAFVIRFASGFRISALSGRPTGLRNKKGRIAIDEAAHHEDLAGLLKAAFAILIWGGRARVDIVSSHNGVDSEFNKYINEVRGEKRKGNIHRITFREAVAQGLYERVCQMNKQTPTLEGKKEWVDGVYTFYGEDAPEELDVVPARSGGVYLSRGLVEKCHRDGEVLRLAMSDEAMLWSEEARCEHIKQWCDENLHELLVALPADFDHYLGEDFGRVADRSVLNPCYINQKMRRVFPFSVEMLNVPFEQQKQIVFYVGDRLPNFRHGSFDATGNGAATAEAAALRYGLDKISQVKLSSKWYAENLPAFKTAFEKGLIEVIRDADHTNDLSSFRVVDGSPILPRARAVKKAGDGGKKRIALRHGDAAIAYLMGHHASRQTTDFAFTSLGGGDNYTPDPDQEPDWSQVGWN